MMIRMWKDWKKGKLRGMKRVKEMIRTIMKLMRKMTIKYSQMKYKQKRQIVIKILIQKWIKRLMIWKNVQRSFRMKMDSMQMCVSNVIMISVLSVKCRTAKMRKYRLYIRVSWWSARHAQPNSDQVLYNAIIMVQLNVIILISNISPHKLN